jgi:hypothetical protein
VFVEVRKKKKLIKILNYTLLPEQKQRNTSGKKAPCTARFVHVYHYYTPIATNTKIRLQKKNTSIFAKMESGLYKVIGRRGQVSSVITSKLPIQDTNDTNAQNRSHLV